MQIRKAILTGGGRATRLYPVTTTINKHLLPLANKAMIDHAIEKVVEAGIKEIFINTNPGETELQAHVGDGARWGVSVTFFEQTGGPQGIAHVVAEAKRFIGDDPFLFYLSDNILLGGVKEMVEEFSRGEYDCMLALSVVKDPERFGVPIFDENKKLIDVLEKPVNPPNSFAVTGIYLYGPKVFFGAFANIEKSPRGEYEISSIHSHLLKSGARVGHKEITGWWKDTGKPEDLLLANQLLLNQMPVDTVLGKSVVVKDGVSIVPPVTVGDGSILERCIIGPYASIGADANISGASIRNSVLLDDVRVEGLLTIENSIIGRHVAITKKDPVPRDPVRLLVGDKTIIEF